MYLPVLNPLRLPHLIITYIEGFRVENRIPTPFIFHQIIRILWFRLSTVGIALYTHQERVAMVLI